MVAKILTTEFSGELLFTTVLVRAFVGAFAEFVLASSPLAVIGPATNRRNPDA